MSQVGPYRAEIAWGELLLQAAQRLLAYRLRTTLTALGVVIAVAGLIAVAGVMAGLEAGVNRAFVALGADVYSVSSNYRKLLAGQSLQDMGVREWQMLERQVQLLHPVAVARLRMPVKDRQGRPAALSIKAVAGDWAGLYGQRLLHGRWLQASDAAGRYRVAVISANAARALQWPQPWLGRRLTLQGASLEVVGVMDEGRSSEGQGASAPQVADVLLTLGLAAELSDAEPALEFGFKLRPGGNAAQALGELRQRLRQSLRLGANEEDDFRIEQAQQLQQTNRSIIAMVSAVLALVVSISLLVGGVGIMNMMLVAVRERTEEIGLLRALGATRRQIRSQFLCEAGLLSVLGAGVGVLLGSALANLVVLVLPQAEFSAPPAWAVGLSVLAALVVGLVSGAWPAAKAAELDPVVALNHG